MQKITLSQIIKEEFIRASIFAIAFFGLISAGFVGIGYAATDGGLFGDILDMILESGDWQNPGDGTVKNATKLGGIAADDYVKVGVNRSCASATQCIYGFDIAGNVLCR